MQNIISTVNPYTFLESNILSMQTSCLADINVTKNWSNVARLISELAQTNIADPNAVTFLQSLRNFVKNPGLADVVVELNGEFFNFQAGKVYCCAPSELLSILSYSQANSLGLVQTDYADYVANGLVSSFFC